MTPVKILHKVLHISTTIVISGVVPIISNPKPCHTQNVDEFPQTLPSLHLTCYSGEENSFTYDSTLAFVNDSSNVFNQPSQPPMYSYKFCGTMLIIVTIVHLKFLLSIIPNRVTIKTLISHKIFKVFNKNILVVKAVEARMKLFNQEEKRIEEEQAAKAQSWKFPVCYDDDDEGYNSLNDNIISELPSYYAVTPTEPIDSLIMGDEHLNTIPTTESNEFIKTCVENLVPNPSESEGENGCDVLVGFITFSNVLFDDDYDSDSSDDQSLSVEDVREKIYSNLLFDEEIIPMEIDQHSFNAKSDLIGSMPNHGSSVIISSKIGSLFDEFVSELTLLKSFSQGIDETDCHLEKEIRFAKRLLYDNSSPRPPEEIVSDNSNADIESFSPSPIPNEDRDSHMEEIDLFLNSDDPMPPGIKEDDDDSERDIPILEELLDNYSLSLPATESYHFDIPLPYRPPAKPPD
nr:hypothetical protein [Tanacetum cinerariifolium]